MAQMNDKCKPATQLEWRGRTYTLGQAISYDTSIPDVKLSRTRTERREGVIAELWIETFRPDELMPYAELEDGARVWFHRDSPGELGDFGRAPEGAMF